MTKNAKTTTKASVKDPVIEFADTGKARFKDVPLSYPLNVDGALVNKITVRRLTAREVKDLQETMDENGFLFERLIQPFTDQPQCVLDALDQDDFAEVAETVVDFLPEKMRAELENARAQMETMLRQRMEDAAETAQQEPSPPGEASLPTSPMPSSGTKTSS
jgi:hypothetical protein